jgi:hypothetical protein
VLTQPVVFLLLLLLQYVIETMREGMLDRAPLGGMPGAMCCRYQLGILLLLLLLCFLQDVIEIMREGMLDRAPLGGMPGGLPLLDFRKAPGSRGGKAGEAARFMAALRAMGSQQGRDVFDLAELQVGCLALVQQRLDGLPVVTANCHAYG